MTTPKQTPVSSGELKAEELMLGNYYMYLHEEHESFHQVTPDFIETQLLYNTDPDNDCFSRGWWARPIPLTPEILEKCGFEKRTIDRYTFHELKIDNLVFNFNHSQLSFGIQGVSNVEWLDRNIDYLHQLQNLYFCLTGEHLKVDEI